MCNVNGSTFLPNATTMNGTFCDIRVAMNATSRLSQSSLATATSHRAFFALATPPAPLRWHRAMLTPVCTENLIRVDDGMESP